MPTQWQLTGDYFESCNCNVVCPCLASSAAPLTARPTQGACDVALIFHVEKGDYGGLSIDGLNVAVKKAPIRYAISGKNRSVEIPGIMQMSVAPIPTMHPSGEIWANLGHPAAPDRLALAAGNPGSTFADYGMRWDNSGKNGHYAPINWSN